MQRSWWCVPRAGRVAEAGREMGIRHAHASLADSAYLAGLYQGSPGLLQSTRGKHYNMRVSSSMYFSDITHLDCGIRGASASCLPDTHISLRWLPSSALSGLSNDGVDPLLGCNAPALSRIPSLRYLLEDPMHLSLISKRRHIIISCPRADIHMKGRPIKIAVLRHLRQSISRYRLRYRSTRLRATDQKCAVAIWTTELGLHLEG